MTKTHLITLIAIFLLSLSAAVYAADDYPYESCNPPEQGDPWAFVTRNCTSYVAWRMNRDAGFTTPPTLGTVLATPSASCYFHNDMMSQIVGGHNNRWSNARYWADRATALGFIVDNIPEVGAIAHWNANEGGAGSGGHVAYVELVNTDGSVNISEYNWNGGDLNYNLRFNVYVPPGRFIHLRKFIANDRAQATDPATSVRSTPGGSVLVATKQTGDTGTVIGGPTGAFSAGNGNYYKWYKVHWDDAIEGWSIEDKLAKSSSPPPDTTPPTVGAFSVTPISLTLGNSFTISYTVSDDIGLNRVELWRANDSGGSPIDWAEILPQRTSLSGTGPTSGSFSDTPSATGSYWYGMHVVDNTGNWNDEKNSNTGGLPGVYGPKKVTVTTPPDTTPPTVTITSPTSNPTYSTSSSPLNIGGTASDNIGVVLVAWANNRGGGNPATGTTSWSANGITLYSGDNVITVTAYDSAGNTGSDTLTVTYTLPTCDCTSWQNVGCGQGGCSEIQMYQTRTCTPGGCDQESRCVYDASCSPNWKSPTATGRTYNEWTNPENAYSSDNQYAVANSWYSDQDWYNFGFTIPSNATIDGIEIKIEGTGDGIDYVGKVKCRVFWGSFALNETDYLEFPATEDTFHTVGGPSDLWGYPFWAPEDFEEGATLPFVIRLTTGADWHTARIDHIQAKVYYTPLKGDINVDGKVDFKDFAILGFQWLQEPGEPSADIAPEILDGVVDILDLAVLADNWLEGTAP